MRHRAPLKGGKSRQIVAKGTEYQRTSAAVVGEQRVIDVHQEDYRMDPYHSELGNDACGPEPKLTGKPPKEFPSLADLIA